MKITKKALSILLAVLMLAGCFSLVASAGEPGAVTTVDVISAAGPISGGNFPKKADLSATADGTVPLTFTRFYVYNVVNGTADTSQQAQEPFVKGNTYMLAFAVALPSDSQLSFVSGALPTCTVNGEAATCTRLNGKNLGVEWIVTARDPKLTLVADPPEAATEFEGAGLYAAGRKVGYVSVNYDPLSYIFLGWYEGDTQLTDKNKETIYNYNMPDHDVTLTAKFAPQTNTGTDGNITWTYDPATQTLTISGSGDMRNYNSDNGIYPPWDYTWSVTKKVVIQNGVTSIGDEAFYYFRNVESVSLPESVTRIGEFAFAACYALKSITLPRGLKQIEQQAFYVTGLTRVTVPGSVETIGIGAFVECESLEEVVLEDGVKKIDESAFYECKWLKAVTVPASVREIGDYAFAGCPTLETINYAGSEEDWNKIIFGEDIFSLLNEVGEPVSRTPNIVYNYAPPKPVNVCHWCGKDHSNGFFQKVIGFFHSILAFFFGKKY